MHRSSAISHSAACGCSDSGAAGARAGRASRRAFTIVEVSMAAGIMALAIATSITTMQRAFLALDTARNVSLAGQIMQDEIERMRLKDWTTINGYAAGPVTLDIDLKFDEAVRTAANATARIRDRFTLTRTTSLEHAGMKKVILTITWQGFDRRTHSRSYTTFYGENGLYDFFYNSI
jgi:hypothetical protein